MKETIKRMIPDGLKKGVWRLMNRREKHSAHLRTSTSHSDIGDSGPLIRDIFEPIKDIPGWFNVDDCGHFYLILSLQSFYGTTGDLFEIGSYHGRSTAMLASCLADGERLVVCDSFEAETEDDYRNKPSSENLLRNILSLNKELDPASIVIHQCLSNDLSLKDTELFRFIHIDGGHSAEQAYGDLVLCKKHLISQGIMVADDYHNKYWPEVTDGIDQFLKENEDIAILADLNRHGALGRKLYLVRN